MPAGYLIVMLPEWEQQALHFYNGIGSMVTDWTLARIYSTDKQAIDEAAALGVPCDVVELCAHLGDHVRRFIPEQRG